MKRLPACLLLLCLCLLPAAAAVQEGELEHAPPAAPAAQAHTETAKEEHAPAEDSHAKFKQSPMVRKLAAATGLSVKGAYWAAVLFNFAIIATIVGYFARKYFPGIFRRRTESIQQEMREAEKASQEANRRLAEIEARLGRLDGEIAEMRAAAEQEAAAEEERIRAATGQDKARLVEAAQQEIAMAARLARRELQAHAAELAVSLAAKRIQVDSVTDQALVNHFASQLTSGDGGEGKR
jgi:F-type H+-transporting ATPase subunit b